MKSNLIRWFKYTLNEVIPQTVALPVLYVTAPTILNNVVNFLVQTAAARLIGPRDFGILSLAISVALLTGTIGELGLNLTTIRLFNKYSDNPTAQRALLGVVLLLKIAIFTLLLLISWPVGQLLSHAFIHDSSGSFLFGIAFATGGLLFFWTYLQSLLQCYRKFNMLAIYIFIYSGLRLLALAVAYILAGKSPLTWLLSAYTIPTAILFIIGLTPRTKQLLKASMTSFQESLAFLREAISYSKWVALSVIAYTTMPYVVRVVLAARASLEEVGIFSAGMIFTMAFVTLNTAVRAVLFPQVTALEGKEQMKRYLERLKKMAPYYIAIALAGIAFLGSLQWFILGEVYREALPVYLITAGAFALVVFLGLGTMLIHTMMKPQVDAYIELCRIFLLILLSFLISPYGAIGVAIIYTTLLLAGSISKFLVVKKWLD